MRRLIVLVVLFRREPNGKWRLWQHIFTVNSASR
jgi:ketosteroid isomerase-like protein